MKQPGAARFGIAAVIALLWIGLSALASAQEMILRCDASQTTADFTLSDALHTVHGSFQGKRGELHFDPALRKLSGEVVFDATSGNSGSAGRDRKMHKDVLDSGRYPEISFRPDTVDGNISSTSASTVQVHGMFGIHGSEHEITVPVAVTMENDHWKAYAHFQVPYVKWGMKNPGLLFLRVGDTVDIDLRVVGSLAAPAGSR